MRFVVPELTLEAALGLNIQLSQLEPNDKFIFDFSQMSNFDPFAMLLSGSIIRTYREKYSSLSFHIEGIDNKSYAGNMGFFKYISPLIDYGKKPGEAWGSSNYIPITPISVDELQKIEVSKGNYLPIGNIIENESERLARIVDRGNPELHKLLTYLIREILRNTPEHAQSNMMWICGQFWPSFKLAEIAILDEGIGIFNSITINPAHREYITDNESALKWALKAGISQSFKPALKQKSDDEWSNSGFGLYMVSQICKRLNGGFCIVSYDNYLKIDNHGIKIGATSFPGTAIRLRVPSKRMSSAQGIISNIAKQGEEEAKMIRNAFKTASQPSKGLMNYLNIE